LLVTERKERRSARMRLAALVEKKGVFRFKLRKSFQAAYYYFPTVLSRLLSNHIEQKRKRHIMKSGIRRVLC
jgi:hypothetical protein